MQSASWLLWAVVLFFQNISFTYVSRARSSGSLVRHLKASIFSNGIWIFSNMLMLGPMFDYLTGKHGVASQVFSGVLYTIACVGGSIFAHHLAMKTEKGKDAVGFNKKYAQIPVEDWEQLQKDLIAVTKIAKAALEVIEKQPPVEEFERIKNLATNAYDMCLGTLPDSGISAKKLDGAIITTGVNFTEKA